MRDNDAQNRMTRRDNDLNYGVRLNMTKTAIIINRNNEVRQEMCGQICNKCGHWNGNKRFKETFTSHTERTFNRFATKGSLHIMLCIDNVMSCDSYFVQLIHIRSHITSHILTMWRNVTCITRMSNTQTSHITSHDNMMQCDLYHVQLLHSHVTIHHMTMRCNVTCITSNFYTVTSQYITFLNNISSPTTSIDLTCRWELFY